MTVSGIRSTSSVWAEQESSCRASGLTVTVVEVIGARQLREAVEWWSLRGWQPEDQVPTGGLLFGVDLGRIAWTFRRIPDEGGTPTVNNATSCR
jgi:hypothetical protein